MRVAVVFLVMLGLLAAVCAAVLVRTLMKPNRPSVVIDKSEEQVDVHVANADLPAMSVVPVTSVTTKKLPKSQVPEGALLNSVQVVGRVLTKNILQGEAFTKRCFASEGDGVHLAAALPPGKRAISVSLSDWSGMAGLLYPGSVVDVLVSFKPLANAGSQNTEVVSTTLLQGLQVLAIGSQSIASKEYADKSPGALASQGKMNHRMVTLLVDSKQAEILQLAIQNGSIALAMRNPLDAGREVQRVSRSSELVQGGAYGGLGNGGGAMAAAARDPADPFAPLDGRPGKLPPPGILPELWETLIIRGSAVEKKSFPMPEEDKPATSRTGKADDGGTAHGNF